MAEEKHTLKNTGGDGTLFGPLTHGIQNHPAFAALAVIAALVLIVFVYNKRFGGAQPAPSPTPGTGNTGIDPATLAASQGYSTQPPINIYNPSPTGGTVVTGTVNAPNPQQALWPSAHITGGNGAFWTDPNGQTWTLVYGGNAPGQTQRIWGVPGRVGLQQAQNTQIGVGQKQLLSGA